MKKTFKNKFTAYQNTIGILDSKSNVYEDYPVAVEAANEFRELLEQIKIIGERIDFDYSKLTARKQQIKHELAEAASALAAAVSIYAGKINDPDLQAVSSKSYSHIRRSADFQSLEQARSLLTLALEHKEQLAGYMVSDEDLADLKRLIEEFDAIYVGKEETFSESVVYNKRLDQLFKQADRVLRNKIDKFVKRLKPVNEDFYESYFQARVIVDL